MPMRINYVRIKVSNVTRNLKIVVHSVFLPFPHIHPSLAENDHILGGGGLSNGAERVATDRTANGHCDALDGSTRCGEVPMPQDRRRAEIEDHNGL
ncbi:hypothetical protein CJ030_MR6G020515 [Morella rubra]|uniref:Uncharacterized protein n=1 Tax=Morella rubra TaxID=262757 RepID=A0A6A1VCH5_9ROSI|nr:hypothetical protein CJ030_MR6G020515 [Morella rubra]